jgi:hypothetical protein
MSVTVPLMAPDCGADCLAGRESRRSNTWWDTRAHLNQDARDKRGGKTSHVAQIATICTIKRSILKFSHSQILKC